MAPVDEAPQLAGLPGVIEDRQQVDAVELVAERAAGKPRRPQAEHNPAPAGLAGLLHPDRRARRHQRRLQRGQVRRLPPGQRGADVGGHPAPVRAAQAPGRAEDLEARPRRRPVIARRGQAEMAAEAAMHLIAAVLQVGQGQRAAGEGGGHQHQVQVIVARVAMPDREPGDLARRQAQPGDRHLRHLDPCGAVGRHPVGQREGHVQDVLRMARRARHALRMAERRAMAQPGDRAADGFGRAERAGLAALGQVAQHRRHRGMEGHMRPHAQPPRFRSRTIRRISAAPSERRRPRSPSAAVPPPGTACAMSFSTRPS